MKYKCRPGIVMEKICGVRFLIPTAEAFDDCPNVFRVTLPVAIIWHLLSHEKSEEDMIRGLQLLTKKPEEEIKNDIERILLKLKESGVVITKELDEES